MPYQRYARILSFVVILLVVYLYLEPHPPGWLVQLTAALSTLVFAAFVLDAYFLISAYRRDEIFFIRNLSLFVSVITAVIFGVLLFAKSGQWTWYFFYPVLLFQSLNNLFLIRLDSVSMTVKTAWDKKEEFALFSLETIKVDENLIEAKLTNGEQFQLQRSLFFPRAWDRLQARMKSIQATRS